MLGLQNVGPPHHQGGMNNGHVFAWRRHRANAAYISSASCWGLVNANVFLLSLSLGEPKGSNKTHTSAWGEALCDGYARFHNTQAAGSPTPRAPHPTQVTRNSEAEPQRLILCDRMEKTRRRKIFFF